MSTEKRPNEISDRLAARVNRQFGPELAAGLIEELSHVSFPLGELQEPERLLAAVVVVADGDVQRFHAAVASGKRDWGDLLVAAGLAQGDWPECLDHELDTGN